jgi:hypothetical protein
MIARFRVLLPYAISVRQGDVLPPFELVLNEYRVRIYPPFRASVDPRDAETMSPFPAVEVARQLAPEEPQGATETIRMDGAPTVQANLLQIDFQKADFDRRPRPKPNGDPPIQLAFAIANQLLGRIRTVSGGIDVKSVGSDRTFWRLDYLTDDEKELAPDPPLFRRRFATPMSWRLAGLNAAIWGMVTALPVDFEPYTWDVLLLDAESLLPEVGASVVLSYAALETFVAWCLDQLAPLSSIPPDLWKWINERGDWYKEPSVSEQYDRLLGILTGKSLKDEPQLWEALQNLGKARNSFAHEGKPILGGKEVTTDQAMRLIGQAKAIVDWAERLLPGALRRPRFVGPVNWELQKMLTAPASPEAKP